MAVEIREFPSKSAPDTSGPPRLTIVQAVQRNLALFLLPVIVLVGIALAIAKVREPNYTSDAALNVGGVTLTIQSIPGYAVATAQLAVAYSRAVYATPVVARVSRQTGLPPAEVIGHISATPVEQTPVLRIRAKASSPRQAAGLANATAQALVAYAATLQGANPDTPRILRRFVANTQRLQQARAAVRRATGDARRRAQTLADVADLQQRTDGLLYQQSVAGDAATSLVKQLAPASIPKSDRTSVFQRLLLGALIGGVLIGVGLALARAHRQSLKRLAPR